MNIEKECRSYPVCIKPDGTYSDCIGCPMSCDEIKWYPICYYEIENSSPEESTVIMKDYKLTIKNIKHYKHKACEMVGSNCNRCEGAYEYNNKIFCVFDTVNRFIEWDNEYNK